MALFEVIRYSGPPGVLVWKYPGENMNTGSRLLVNQSQEAVFVRDGVICDVLGPGSHTLDTNNLPFLSSLANLPFGRKSPFTAEVYFVNRLTNLDIKWGTAVPVQLSDPVYHVAIPLRAFGQYGIAVEDGRLFMEKVVGTSARYTAGELVDYFRGLVGSRIVEELTGYMLREGISFLEVNAHIAQIAGAVSENLTPLLAGYGVRLVNFCINSINAPENDPSVKKLRMVLDKKNEMDMIHYSYKEERSFNAVDHLASSGGGMTGIGSEVAVGAALAEALKGPVKEAMSPEPQTRCIGCGEAIKPGMAFCPKCGIVQQRRAQTCRACGAALGERARFCEKCGAPVEREPEPLGGRRGAP